MKIVKFVFSGAFVRAFERMNEFYASSYECLFVVLYFWVFE